MVCFKCGGAGQVQTFQSYKNDRRQSLRALSFKEHTHLVDSYRKKYGAYRTPPIKEYSGDKFLFQPDGKGTSVHKDGVQYTGKWSSGLWHGVGSVVRPGCWELKGTFTKGFLDGECLLVKMNGARFELTFKKGKVTGRGFLRWGEGDLFEGTFKSTTEASGKYTDVEGNCFEGEIYRGVVYYKNSGVLRSKKVVIGYFLLNALLAGDKDVNISA